MVTFGLGLLSWVFSSIFTAALIISNRSLHIVKFCLSLLPKSVTKLPWQTLKIRSSHVEILRVSDSEDTHFYKNLGQLSIVNFRLSIMARYIKLGKCGGCNRYFRLYY
jgi:hypothetical protein